MAALGLDALAHTKLGKECMKTQLMDTRGAQRCYKGLIRALGSLSLAVILVGCAGNRYERSTGESVDDTATTGRVKRALSADETYRYPNVKVTTFKGNVQLSGFVESNGQKSKAGDLAKATPGVKDVENRITVK
jgi:hypothetical protein